MTKYHRLAGLNTRHLFLPALEVGKSEIKILSDLILGKDFLPGLQTAHILTLITLLTWPFLGVCTRVERDLSLFLALYGHQSY